MFFAINLFTFYNLEVDDKEKEKILIPLADICNEFRFLPNPYGDMANDLCEVLENEILFTGISRMKRLIMDFPNITEFTRKGEKRSLAHLQDVIVYHNKPYNNNLINLLKHLDS